MAETEYPALRKRRWMRFLACVAGVLLLLALIYPLWFPWVLKPVAAGFGVEFGDFRRHGYAGIELRDVRMEEGPVFVRAERIDLQLPHRWVWARDAVVGTSDPQVIVRKWRVEIGPSGQTSGGGIGSTAELLDELQPVVPPLSRWVRSILLTDGEVALAESRYVVPLATVQGGQFAVDAFDSRAVIDFASLAEGSLGVLVSNALGAAEVALNREDVGWAFLGGVDWQSNRIELNGLFDRKRWMPANATLGTDSLSVPSALFGAGEVPDLHGSARAEWVNDSYSFDVNLTNLPPAGSEGLFQTMSLLAGGRGDLGLLELTRLELAAPFLTINLDKPLRFDFGGSVEGRNATLKLWADLSRIDAIDVEGELSGRVTVRPTVQEPLLLSFSLHGAGIAGAGVRTKSVAASGQLDWPLLQVTNLTAELDSGGRLAADLELELGPRQPTTSLSWRFDGPPPVELAESVKFKTVHASGTAQGIWPDLTHVGRVEVRDLAAGAFRAVRCRLDWEGHGLVMDRMTARLENGSSTIELRGNGSAEFAGAGTQVGLACDALELVTPEGVWNLSQPVQLDLLRGTNGLALSLSPLELAGPDSRMKMQASVNWPDNGSGEIALHGLRSGDLRDFLAPDLPELAVPEAALSFAWDNGPMVFDFHAAAQWRESSNTVWAVAGRVSADGQSLQMDSLRVDLNAVPCAELSGHLPVGIEPANGWRIIESTSNTVARFDLRVVEEGPLWSLIEKRAGVRIAEPTVRFRVRGEMPEVRGELAVRARRVHLMNTNVDSAFVVPDLEDVQLEAALDLNGVILQRAEAQLLGQAIRAQARWDIDARGWTEWWNALRAPDWQRLAGTLRLEEAQMSALSATAPGVIAPIGRIDLDLALEPGRRVTGHVRIANGATRFLKPLGALRDIEADVTWNGWNATVNSFTATLGGRPVGLSGDLAWRADGDRRFDLRLTGRNLSLVREADLFMRADLDLRLQKSFDEVARLSGEVQLQRSLLFRDFNSLIGFNRDQPEQRPPYFSVSQAPFGDWQLDVRVKGDRFLNVFSPAFKGEVSAGLQLEGTLREPLAVGAVTVDSGKILFPFGTLQLESGRVDLTRDDPYRPRLDFRASGLNYGYSVTVDVQGPLDAPNLTFQSVPPLSAQQILLMLTAGEIPRSDFGYDSTDKAGRVGLYVGREFVNRFIGNTSTTERLELRSGEDITDDGKPTYSIEYRFTDRWSAFGEYNRFQNVNSGLKFKVLSK